MRLEVSRRADLAIRAMVALGQLDRRAKAPELAQQVGTTPGFLSQVLAPLVGHGWVRSDPGPTGGYSPAVSLDDVSLLKVIEAVEGPSNADRCVLEDRMCGEEGPCALHAPWGRARRQLLGELDSTPLSSLLVTKDS